MADPVPPFMYDVHMMKLSSNGKVLNPDIFLESPKSQLIGKRIDGLHPYFYSDLIDSYYSHILSGDYHYHRDSCFIAAADKDNYNNNKRITGQGKHPKAQLQISRDIQEEIISRLPTRSIVRFGSVSKDWYAMSHDPIVALAQLSHTTATNNLHHHHLMIYPGRPLPKVHLIQCNKGVSGIGGAHTVFDLKPLDRDMKVIGSINGILCLIDHHNDGAAVTIYLYNPLLGDYLQLPSPPKKNNNNKAIIRYGFGFDNARLEFKVVRYVKSKHRQIQLCVVPMQGNAYATPQPWKTKRFKVHTDERLFPDQRFYLYRVPLNCDGDPLTLLDGKLHCLTNNQYGEQLILSFDIASEEITLIPLPVHTFSWRDHISRLGELGGNLFAVPTYIVPNETFELYVLKDYGDPESWTKLLDLCGPDECTVPYMWNERRILLRDCTYRGKQVDPCGSTYKSEWMEPYIVHHTPTLVSLKPNQNLL